jgi:RecA-family ATPase
MAPRFVIPGFIGHGLVIVAGTHGVGKTTALLPLAMVAAGLHRHGDPLAPKHWRHVVYIVEDAEQALRIVAGIVKFGGLGLDVGTVRERLHIVEARRLVPSYVAEVATAYREQFARMVEGVEVPPLVVMDTKSAVLEMEEENSNSEASAIVALLKQSFESLPVWMVGHVAKASRGEVAGLSLRGGSAFEADANQVLYLVKEGDARFLVRGKTRFEALWPELQIESKTAATMARDEYGDPQSVVLRWGIASPPAQSRKEAQEQAHEAARKADAAAMRANTALASTDRTRRPT